MVLDYSSKPIYNINININIIQPVPYNNTSFVEMLEEIS